MRYGVFGESWSFVARTNCWRGGCLVVLRAVIEACRTDQAKLFSVSRRRSSAFAMGIVIPLVSVTAFWLAIGVGGPFLVPKGINRGIIQTMIILTAVCCYMFWLLVFLHQLNPLIGPQIPVRTILWMAEKWGTIPNPVNN